MVQRFREREAYGMKFAQTDQQIKTYLKQGDNCCEAILKTADKFWQLGLRKETLWTARFFKEGMHSGCACGALVGIVMVSGILEQTKANPFGSDLPSHLHSKFIMENGSSCCRVLRNNQGLRERINNKGCCAITEKAMRILIEAWEDNRE